MDAAESTPSAFDPLRPSVARVYDYLLGGKDNFAADRSLGDRIIASLPTEQDGVQAELQQGMGRGQFRTLAQIRSVFGGLELVEPGLVPVAQWRPDPDTPSADDLPVLRLACAGVARKP